MSVDSNDIVEISLYGHENAGALLKKLAELPFNLTRLNVKTKHGSYFNFNIVLDNRNFWVERCMLPELTGDEEPKDDYTISWSRLAKKFKAHIKIICENINDLTQWIGEYNTKGELIESRDEPIPLEPIDASEIDW